jgi:hypothetical protein
MHVQINIVTRNRIRDASTGHSDLYIELIDIKIWKSVIRIRQPNKTIIMKKSKIAKCDSKIARYTIC